MARDEKDVICAFRASLHAIFRAPLPAKKWLDW